MENLKTIPDGKIKDYVDGKFRNDTPEEYVRQTIEKRLVEEHRYKAVQIAVEFGLKVGSKKPRADLVIWEESAEKIQDNAKIIIECKQEKIKATNSKDGIEQLKSYMSVCPNCEWGMWTNSVQKFVFRKVQDKETGEFKFEDYNDIPSANANIAEIDRPTRQSLKNAVDDNLLFVFRTCHDYIYANDGLHKDKAFFEFLKIIFCKIEDEKNIPKPLEFFATSGEVKNPDGQLTVKNRIAKIFERVKKRYGKIFNANDELLLQPRSLAKIVSELQKYSLLNTNIDIKGKAYEEIVGANLRGDRGEFFTPRNIMRMVVDMIEPQTDETVLDSSCGTGGFLVIAMTHVINLLANQFEKEYGRRENWTDDVKRQFSITISELAKKNYFGFDLNPDLVKATKMNMVMNNDGSGNILQANSLLPPHEWSEKFKSQIANALEIEVENLRDHKSISLFDVIVTNPPFGSKIPIDDENILKQFELAHLWNFEGGEWIMTDKFQSSVPPEILFVERCTQFLKPGGRMGIILPDSILGSPGLGYIRTWILKNHKVLASLDLHADTFQPHNGTQTSVLILQKKFPNEILDDYEIFTAMVEKVGHDKRGNTLYKRDNDGNEILDDDGEKILDDETAAIAQTYLDYKKKLPPTSLIKFFTIKLSDVLAHGNRLEASIYNSENFTSVEVVKNSKFGFTNLLDSVNAAYHPPRFKRNYISKKSANAVPFLGSSEMLDVKPNALKFLPRSMAENLNLFVKQGTILISCSGTIGNVSFVNETLSKFVFSQHIIRLECENYGGYIYTCLKSRCVQAQIQSLIYGAVIPEIEPEHLSAVVIPDAPANLKEKIHQLIVKSYNLRDESNALIDAATKILIEELQLPALEDFDNKKIFTVNVNNLFGRLDASYHLPIVGEIVNHLKSHAAEVTTIGDNRISANVILPGRFKRVYVDEGHGVTFFGGRSIGELNPSDKKYLSFAMHDKKIRDELTIHENYILVTCSGTIGNIALVPKHWDGWAMTHDIIRLVTNEKICGYVYIWLNTDYANKIINSKAYGAVVRHIEKNHLEEIPIPLLKNSVAQEKINALALLANEKRYEAYLLEQAALKIMDEEILN